MGFESASCSMDAALRKPGQGCPVSFGTLPPSHAVFDSMLLPGAEEGHITIAAGSPAEGWTGFVMRGMWRSFCTKVGHRRLYAGLHSSNRYR